MQGERERERERERQREGGRETERQRDKDRERDRETEREREPTILRAIGGASRGPQESAQLMSKQFVPQLETIGSRSSAQPSSDDDAGPPTLTDTEGVREGVKERERERERERETEPREEGGRGYTPAVSRPGRTRPRRFAVRSIRCR